MAGTGRLERKTLALLWEGVLEYQDFILMGHGESEGNRAEGAGELGFGKMNLDVYWQDPQRGWSQGVFLSTLILSHRRRNGGPRRPRRLGYLWRGQNRRVLLVQELTWGGGGQCGSLGGDLGKSRLPSPAMARLAPGQA